MRNSNYDLLEMIEPKLCSDNHDRNPLPLNDRNVNTGSELCNR